MATKKTKDRIDGTDRFTSKGYGIVPGPLTAKQKAEIAELNKELNAAKKKKPAAKKR
jgi:hypothetical protein